jgi:hypothetical protein
VGFEESVPESEREKVRLEVLPVHVRGIQRARCRGPLVRTRNDAAPLVNGLCMPRGEIKMHPHGNNRKRVRDREDYAQP